MAAGRRPKPTFLKLVAGNPGRRPLNSSEPAPQNKRPPPPRHLSEQARKTWARMSSILGRMGLLTEADGVALELLCEAYADYLEARDTLKAFGGRYYETTNAAGGVMHRPHPALAAMADADRRIRAWLAEFGQTPSSRSKVQVGDGKTSDPAEKYFR